MFYFFNELFIFCFIVLLDVKFLFFRYIFVKYVCVFVMNICIFFCDKYCFFNYLCSNFFMLNVNCWFMFIFILIFFFLVSFLEFVYVFLYVLVKINWYMFVLV